MTETSNLAYLLPQPHTSQFKAILVALPLQPQTPRPSPANPTSPREISFRETKNALKFLIKVKIGNVTTSKNAYI